MTQKRSFIDKNGNTWEWDETPETLKAIQELHKQEPQKDDKRN